MTADAIENSHIDNSDIFWNLDIDTSKPEEEVLWKLDTMKEVAIENEKEEERRKINALKQEVEKNIA